MTVSNASLFIFSGQDPLNIQTGLDAAIASLIFGIETEVLFIAQSITNETTFTPKNVETIKQLDELGLKAFYVDRGNLQLSEQLLSELPIEATLVEEKEVQHILKQSHKRFNF